MLRILYPLFLLCCLVFSSLTAQASPTAPNVPSINLDRPDTSNLLPAQYLLAPSEQFNFDTVTAAADWQSLGRDQLRFGLINDSLWLDMPFRTEGTRSKTLVLQFNRIIEFIEVQLHGSQGLLGEYQLGEFLQTPSGQLTSNKNTLYLSLEPGKEYRILAKIHSTHSIIGPIQLWDKDAYQAHDQLNLYLLIAYAVTAVTISLYNLAYFFSSHYRAFLYHAAYGLTIFLFQTNQYGYLDKLLYYLDFISKPTFSIICIGIAYSAVLLFIVTVVEHKQEPVFARIIEGLVAFNGLVILASPLMPFSTTLLLFSINLGFGILTGLTHLAYLAHQRNRKGWGLLLLMLMFAPSSLLLALNRLGMIDDSFWSEYLILLIIIAEMLFTSLLVFKQIRSMRQQVWQAQHFDPGNGLPNRLALKTQIQSINTSGMAYALTYVWVSGLEKMEIARGLAFRDSYLHTLAQLADEQLQAEGFILSLPCKTPGCFSVFYCEKNTLGIITHPLNTLEHERLHKTLHHAFDTIKQAHGYNLDISPVLASSNAFCLEKDSETVLHNTNVALSQCIQNNGSLLLYNDDVGYNERRQIQLLNDFEQALADNQFYLEWQPQLDSNLQTLAGLEALVRWRHPEYGTVSPAQFIPLLEQNLKITQLSAWVLRQVLAVAPAFLGRYPKLDISINLSVYDLMSEKLLPFIDDLLEHTPESGKLTRQIILEVTESVHIEDNQQVLAAVEELQERGFRISIDDFGAGYASFGYLQTLPADELKIDRRYTETCHQANSQAIIRSIIDLANRLGMKIVVEGIENQQQQDLFTEWGAHRLQGWKLGKPRPQQEILASFA